MNAQRSVIEMRTGSGTYWVRCIPAGWRWARRVEKATVFTTKREADYYRVHTVKKYQSAYERRATRVRAVG